MKTPENNLKELCLEITDACPMECMHCSGSCDLTSGNTLSLDEIKKIISDFICIGGKTLEISGGEPLMHRNLFEIIKYAKLNGLETVLYTCGTALDEGRKESLLTSDLAENLRNIGLDKIIFNLQGATVKGHERITQKEGSFRNVITSIKNMKSSGCWVGVHFVPMKPNYLDLKGVIGLCHSFGVDEVGLLRFVPQGRGLINRKYLELSQEEFRDLIKDIIGLKLRYKNPVIRVGRPLNFCPLFCPSITKEICDAGITRCGITPDANVVPCPAFKKLINQNRNFIAGNLKVDSLVDIWRYSPIWKDFREFDYLKMDEPCKSCEHLHWCQGGCKAQRFFKNNTGNPYSAPDPLCFAHCSQYERVEERLVTNQVAVIPA